MIPPDEQFIKPVVYAFTNYYRMVERDDLYQELCLWWMTHQKLVVKFAEAEGGKDRKLAGWKLDKALRGEAARFCRAEKASKQGYRVEDEFFYNAALVKTLLPMVWNPELIVVDQQADLSTGKIRATKKANEGNNLPAMAADVGRVVKLVDADEYAVLYLRYALDTEYGDIAEQLDITPAAAESRNRRAVDRIVELLGGETPWIHGPGARHAMSNAQSQAITSQQESGE